MLLGEVQKKPGANFQISSLREVSEDTVLPIMHDSVMQSVANHESLSKLWCLGLLFRVSYIEKQLLKLQHPCPKHTSKNKNKNRKPQACENTVLRQKIEGLRGDLGVGQGPVLKTHLSLE